jgi:hypothetical protein
LAFFFLSGSPGPFSQPDSTNFPHRRVKDVMLRLAASQWLEVKVVTRKIMAILTIFGLATTFGQSAHAQELQPGQWHIVTQGSTTTNGQQTMLPKNEMDSCVTPQAAKEAMNVMRQPPSSDCKTDLLWRSGSKSKTRTTCPNSIATADFDIGATSYSSVTHVEMRQSGGGTAITTDVTVTGSRVGDCSQ